MRSKFASWFVVATEVAAAAFASSSDFAASVISKFACYFVVAAEVEAMLR
jgi:hypothetical protein